MSRTKTLPQDEQDLLQKLRNDENLPVLRARVNLLRNAGWTLASIGAPLKAPRSTVRMWERSPVEDYLTEAEKLAPIPECYTLPPDVREARVSVDVPVEERARLHALAAQARNVRGWTPKDSPDRAAADELTRLLIEYKSRGVPIKRLAFHMGVTHRAVAARLERHEEKVNA